MQLVKCRDEKDNLIYIPMPYVKGIYREDRDERDTIIDTGDGKVYVCGHEDYYGCKLENSLVSVCVYPYDVEEKP